MIKPGNVSQSYVPVLSVLNAGYIVVTSGAYLLNSEAIFKNEGDNMAGMKM
jgi:membrane fusion protein, copper/silver efflux system